MVLELESVIAASRPRLFRAFADPAELRSWWGPLGFTIPSLDFEPRVGERYRIEMQPPDGEAFYLVGEFRQVAEPARLAFTFRWENPDPDDVENLVELSFRDRGDSTVVRLRQAPFKTEARLELHRAGWSDGLEKLRQRLTR
jgi:uncharacterized protein YndB with AHSA1/START domain